MVERIKPKVPLNDAITIRTFMIGTIDLLEQYFGDSWGHGKDESEHSDDEDDNYEKFLEVRERILDMGNDLIKKNGRKPNRRQVYGQ